MTSARKSTASKPPDAVALLKADHAEVKKLFKTFEKLHRDDARGEAQEVARQICMELTIHATIEEEIFYPALREVFTDQDLVDEAEVEHASAKDLIAQIEAMNVDDAKFAAKVIVLGEYIDHHVKEEQDEIFPKAKKTELDMKDLGQRLSARKQELKSEMVAETA